MHVVSTQQVRVPGVVRRWVTGLVVRRIRKKEPVTAWYFTAADSIEGAMIRVIDAKWEDVQGIVDGKTPEGFMAKALEALLSMEEGSHMDPESNDS